MPNNYRQHLGNLSCDMCTDYIPECQNCATTCRSCQKGNTNICLDCFPTMKLQNGTCVCRNQQDNRNIFFQCSMDNTAVLQAYLASDSPTLTKDFGIPSQIQNLSCKQLFQDSTLNQLGSNVVCSMSSTKITVALSNDATIMETQRIQFKNDVISYKENMNIVQVFYLASFTQLRNQIPVLNFQYDAIKSTCNDIIFKFLSVSNDTQRGFYSFQWSIQMNPSPDQQTLQQINSIIQNSNSQKSCSNTKIHTTLRYFNNSLFSVKFEGKCQWNIAIYNTLQKIKIY
ncbi:hypothetical protein ABPG72_017492 [Tetrahymena utriculariae]